MTGAISQGMKNAALVQTENGPACLIQFEVYFGYFSKFQL
jgi:hypothetical protein